MSKPSRFPPLPALAAFEAAARLGGFNQAAAELCITPSAVSHRIRQLESHLGEGLFERTGTGIRLNRAGQNYLQGVSEVFHHLGKLGDTHAAVQTKLQLGVPPTFARNLLVPALPDFYRQWPEIEIEIDIEAPMSSKPRMHDVDIRWGRRQGQNSHATRHEAPLFTDHLIALASPTYRNLRKLDCPEDLRNAELLRTPLLEWQPWLNAANLDWPEPISGMQFTDLGLLLEAAANGLGVAMCISRLAQTWIDSGRLEALFDLKVDSPKCYWLISDAKTMQRWEVATFHDWALARFST